MVKSSNVLIVLALVLIAIVVISFFLFSNKTSRSGEGLVSQPQGKLFLTNYTLQPNATSGLDVAISYYNLTVGSNLNLSSFRTYDWKYISNYSYGTYNRTPVYFVDNYTTVFISPQLSIVVFEYNNETNADLGYENTSSAYASAIKYNGSYKNVTYFVVYHNSTYDNVSGPTFTSIGQYKNHIFILQMDQWFSDVNGLGSMSNTTEHKWMSLQQDISITKAQINATLG